MRTVLVTGGASGIGKAIALHLLNQGHRVVVADVNDQALEKMHMEFNQDRLLLQQTDVRDDADIESLFEFCDTLQFHFDAIINNAGMGSFKALSELTVKEIDDGIALLLRAPLIISQNWIKRREKKSGYGRIVNISSTRALMSEANNEVYSMCKGGLISLTQALAVSLQPYHIQVNAISPGWIDTKNSEHSKEDHLQHPSNRVGVVEDIVLAIDYLLEEKNEFINGQNLVIDGGMTKKMIYVD